MISVDNQVSVFLYSIVGGIIMAFIYDIFRIKRKKVKSKAFTTYLEDIAYWIIAAAVMFGSVYISNDGEIRSYVLLGTLIGIIFYTIFLSKIVVAVILVILKVLTRIFISLWKLVSYPFFIIFRILKVPLGFLFRLIAKTLRKTRRISRIKLSIHNVKRRIFKNSRKKI
jgi:spore cortex biosynthesis protein YabQ